ncbi:MAG TPA: cytochrome b/b6 domain-containing protein [Rudaea sp.]|nr:cytochrome b/b6 domain-containing protein [Rudaea sp.]
MSANDVRVWDLPTRLFHWILTVLLVMQYATASFGVLDMRWHVYLGYATLALVLFRVLWGFFGSPTSRFAAFVRGPAAVLGYLRAVLSTNPQRSIGHNPAGGWAVLALLGCVVLQGVSGLFARDFAGNAGALAAHVSERTVRFMSEVHEWNQNLLLILVAIHIVAVMLYLVLGNDNLILPMITGRKTIVGKEPEQASPTRALALLAIAVAAVAALVFSAR